jgi:protein-disulfide isomerase
MLIRLARTLRAVSSASTGLLIAAIAASCRPPYASAQAGTAPTNAAPAAVAHGEDVPAWGDEHAPVTVIEFADLECPFTERVAPTVARLRETYGPSQVRIVWRHFPLPFHAHARKAHDAAATVLALGGSDAFFKFTELALSHRDELNDAAFVEWAEQAGVPRDRFQRARQQNAEAAWVERDLAVGAKLGVNGTPNFLVNGVWIDGAQPFERFKQVIDNELVEARKLPAAEASAQRTQLNFKPRAADNRASEEEDTSVWQVPVASDDPVRGPKDAPVTIVMWSDYQCPFCKRVESTLAQIRSTYPEQVRFIWKDNPLPFHPRALPAAVLARIVYTTRGQDAFWQAHDALFEAQADLDDDTLDAIGSKFGVRYSQVEKGKQRDQALAKLEESSDLAAGLKANGTPHFFINGVRLSGSQPFDKFKAIIDRELEKANALKARGVAAADVYAELMKSATPPPPPETKSVPAPDASSPVRGNPRARITIQEFSDFQCPYCKRVNPTLAALEKEYGADVRVVFRHSPLPFHEHAALAAEASQEAFAQKGNAGFWAYHDKLFEAQDEPGGLERTNLEAIALAVGLDLKRFTAALDSHRHAAKVQEDMEIAEKAGIGGTPGFVINGYFVGGAQSLPAFKRVVRRALADMKKSP